MNQFIEFKNSFGEKLEFENYTQVMSRFYCKFRHSVKFKRSFKACFVAKLVGIGDVWCYERLRVKDSVFIIDAASDLDNNDAFLWNAVNEGVDWYFNYYPALQSEMVRFAIGGYYQIETFDSHHALRGVRGGSEKYPRPFKSNQTVVLTAQYAIMFLRLWMLGIIEFDREYMHIGFNGEPAGFIVFLFKDKVRAGIIPDFENPVKHFYGLDVIKWYANYTRVSLLPSGYNSSSDSTTYISRRIESSIPSYNSCESLTFCSFTRMMYKTPKIVEDDFNLSYLCIKHVINNIQKYNLSTSQINFAIADLLKHNELSTLDILTVLRKHQVVFSKPYCQQFYGNEELLDFIVDSFDINVYSERMFLNAINGRTLSYDLRLIKKGKKGKDKNAWPRYEIVITDKYLVKIRKKLMTLLSDRFYGE